MRRLDAQTQASLGMFFQTNMKELLLEENTFERALDTYQVIYAAYDDDQLRIARQRRKLVAQIADQTAFVSSIEKWLNSGDYQSILDYGKSIALHI